MKRSYNFGPGPAILPTPVLEQSSRSILEFEQTGMSILEVSHRSKDYEKVHFEAQKGLLRLMGLDSKDYSVLFLTGGASLQFSMIPQSFLNSTSVADYVNTGEWAVRAIHEAKRFGQVNVASSSEDRKFSVIDKNLKLTPNARYVHITTNNTIEGTQWAELPDTRGVPLVADASSDILSREMDYSRFSLLYAGAQKNGGPAGLTVVVIKNEFLEKASRDVPTMLSYHTHAKADSLYNTPPVFAIYVFNLVLKWIEELGGLAVLEKKNREKAALIYGALDEFPDFYEPTVTDRRDRSQMNITFRLKDPARETAFLAGAQALGMEGLKGHRSVGGFRASVYNAFPVEGARALATYLRTFRKS